MARPLVFMMGRSPVILPTDRRYARNHMWAAAVETGLQLGFSAYAVRLLGDVHHLEWSAETGAKVAWGEKVGFIEGSKATSDLYAPVGGMAGRLNPDVLAKPLLVNTNLYDAGWLLVIDGGDEELLSAEEYLSHVEASWPLAQRMLKGQAGKTDVR
ncbi:MAG: glycine cleavage system protein H [Planctomycetota bacterium]|jgi:glycine cleavage system H protein